MCTNTKALSPKRSFCSVLSHPVSKWNISGVFGQKSGFNQGLSVFHKPWFMVLRPLSASGKPWSVIVQPLSGAFKPWSFIDKGLSSIEKHWSKSIKPRSAFEKPWSIISKPLSETNQGQKMAFSIRAKDLSGRSAGVMLHFAFYCGLLQTVGIPNAVI